MAIFNSFLLVHQAGYFELHILRMVALGWLHLALIDVYLIVIAIVIITVVKKLLLVLLLLCILLLLLL